MQRRHVVACCVSSSGVSCLAMIADIMMLVFFWIKLARPSLKSIISGLPETHLRKRLLGFCSGYGIEAAEVFLWVSILQILFGMVPTTSWCLVNMWMPLGLKLLSDRVLLKGWLASQSHWIAFGNIFFLGCFVEKFMVLAATLDSRLPLAVSVYMIGPCVIQCSLGTFWEKSVKKAVFFNIKGRLFLMGTHAPQRQILGLRQDKLPGCKRVGNRTGSLNFILCSWKEQTCILQCISVALT